MDNLVTERRLREELAAKSEEVRRLEECMADLLKQTERSGIHIETQHRSDGGESIFVTSPVGDEARQDQVATLLSATFMAVRELCGLPPREVKRVSGETSA